MADTANLAITKIESGQSNQDVTANNAFDTLDKALAGRAVHNMASDADYTLTEAQYLNAVVRITDTGVVLTGAKNIILPTAVTKMWRVDNQTAQTLTFKTSAGTGVAVTTGNQAWVYGDGTNIVAT